MPSLSAPLLIDIALAAILLEAAALVLLRRKWAHLASPRGVAANIAAGGMLLVTARLAAAEASWMWIGLALAGALIAHLADIGSRLGTRSN